MLKKKLWREILHNKGQFFTLFLMVFLASLAFSGVHAYMDGMKHSMDTYYENNNLQDIWVSKAQISDKDMEDIQDINHVNEAEKQINIRTRLEEHNDVTIETIFLETNEINKMYLVKGEEYNQNKEGIWLDSYLANNLDIDVGDTITLSYGTYSIKEEVKGLVMSPDHVYSIKDDTQIFPTHEDFGFAYLSYHEFFHEMIYDQLAKQMGVPADLVKSQVSIEELREYYPFNTIIVDVDREENVEIVKNEIQETIPDVIAVTDRSSSVSYQGALSEYEEGQTYSGVFTGLFVFIALLSVLTTMNRFIRKQRVQIGTLKALGFQDRKIKLHYISYGFFISLAASFFGMILGALTIGNFFLDMIVSKFEIPDAHIVILPIVYVVSLVIVLMVTLVTYLSTRRILNETASQALRLEAPKIKESSFQWTTKNFFRKMSISTKWNLRDIARNKLRTCMAVSGVTGCTMLIVCAFGFTDTIYAYFDWEFQTLCQYNYKLTLKDDISNTEFQRLLDDYGNSTSQTQMIEINLDDSKKVNSLTINDANGLLAYTNHNLELMQLKDSGVYLTEKLAKQYGLNVGDDIKWHIFNDNTWYTTQISGLVRDPQNQQLFMTREAYEKLGLNYSADTLYTKQDLAGVSSIEGVETILSKDSQQKDMSSMLESMQSMVVLLIVIAVILGFVVIYNMGILSFTEKQYQFATLRVLGFQNKQVKKIFIKQNLWITVVSIILGLPLGYELVVLIYRYASGENYDFEGSVAFITYIIAIIGTLIVSYCVNLFLARKIKTIDMVSSLKANE